MIFLSGYGQAKSSTTNLQPAKWASSGCKLMWVSHNNKTKQNKTKQNTNKKWIAFGLIITPLPALHRFTQSSWSWQQQWRGPRTPVSNIWPPTLTLCELHACAVCCVLCDVVHQQCIVFVCNLPWLCDECDECDWMFDWLNGLQHQGQSEQADANGASQRSAIPPFDKMAGRRQERWPSHREDVWHFPKVLKHKGGALRELLVSFCLSFGSIFLLSCSMCN